MSAASCRRPTPRRGFSGFAAIMNEAADDLSRGIVVDAPACACSRKYAGGDLLHDFTKIREGCPALNLVLLPDGIWPAFLDAAGKKPNEALHQSMLVLAFQRGHLEHVTGPVHRYLLADGRVKPELRKQYAQDLRERWLLETGRLERHRESRRFTGRLVELLCTQWLETGSWRVTGLEAFREGPDIAAEHDGEGPASFEVKSLGQEDSDFEAIVASLHGPAAVQIRDLYAAANYMLFRVYEAAKQLQQFEGRRIVLIVVNEIAWHAVEFQLRGNWIDWRDAKLLEAKSTSWQAFIEEQRKRYPRMDGELSAVIRSVDDIRIFKLRYGFELSEEFRFTVAG